jgi:hypothetical protein
MNISKPVAPLAMPTGGNQRPKKSSSSGAGRSLRTKLDEADAVGGPHRAQRH